MDIPFWEILKNFKKFLLRSARPGFYFYGPYLYVNAL
jgi:hypothetical protein